MKNEAERCSVKRAYGIPIAKYAHGMADFIAKLQIALKEANKTDYTDENQYHSPESKRESLRAMLVSSLNTPKKNKKS